MHHEGLLMRMLVDSLKTCFSLVRLAQSLLFFPCYTFVSQEMAKWEARVSPVRPLFFSWLGGAAIHSIPESETLTTFHLRSYKITGKKNWMDALALFRYLQTDVQGDLFSIDLIA